MEQTIDAGRVMACRCAPCRGIPADWSGAWRADHVPACVANSGSHYYDTDTVRFFGARILGFRVWRTRPAAGAHVVARPDVVGATVRESIRDGFGPDAGRAYRLAIFCRFGSLVARLSGVPTDAPGYRGGDAPTDADWSPAQCKRWDDSRAAEDYARDVIAMCDCHGCTLHGVAL